MITQILLYSLKSAFTLTLLYVPYLLILQKEKFFLVNRFVLLIIISLSLLLPFCDISWLSLDTSPVIIATHQQMIDIGMPVNLIGHFEGKASNAENLPSVSWFDVVAVIYFIGMVGAIIIRCTQMGILTLGLRSRNIWVKYEDGIRICCRHGHFSPYCWMKTIVISEEDWNEAHDEILLHEKGHIKAGHSIDMLALMFCQAIQWYNPFAWLIINSLADIHEYEADDYVLRQGVSLPEYQSLLIKKAVGSSAYVFANKFKHRLIKKRILMMNNEKNNPWRTAKVLYIVPLICIALSAFSNPTFIEAYDALPESYNTLTAEDSLRMNEIKKIYTNCEALYFIKTEDGLSDSITSNRNVKNPSLSFPEGSIYIDGKLATAEQIRNFRMEDYKSFSYHFNPEKEIKIYTKEQDNEKD